MTSVCVPVLKRYDLLQELIVSLRQGTVRPERICVINNGDHDIPSEFDVEVLRPEQPMGVAASWNWFITNTTDDRVIVNDDILFAPESLALLVGQPHDFVSCTFGFSCFLIRDACVRRVGLFDETISPGYAYFEDMDYFRRMRAAGIVDKVVQCGVRHRHSATLAAYTRAERKEHDRRFELARQNYTRKWACNPSWEQLRDIGGAGANA